MAQASGGTSQEREHDAASRPAALRHGIQKVDIEAPWRWLRSGWRDLLQARKVSVSFGVVIALASLLLINLLWHIDLLPYALPLAAGFMFVAPAAAICFYDISRRLDPTCTFR